MDLIHERGGPDNSFTGLHFGPGTFERNLRESLQERLQAEDSPFDYVQDLFPEQIVLKGIYGKRLIMRFARGELIDGPAFQNTLPSQPVSPPIETIGDGGYLT